MPGLLSLVTLPGWSWAGAWFRRRARYFAGRRAPMTRKVGVCARWDPRGFGFLVTPERACVFVHASALGYGAALAPGELVAFTSRSAARGPRAEYVRRLPPVCGKCDRALFGLRCAACRFLVGT